VKPLLGTIDELLSQTEKNPAGRLISKKEAKSIRLHFNNFFGADCESEKMGWEEVTSRVMNVDLLLDPKHYAKKLATAESIHQALFELKMAVLNELTVWKFVIIENKKSEFLEQKNLFGKQARKAFPSARDEIRLAGNCLAMDLNTAAVFHLMRAAEFGMRTLATHLKVKLKGRPIEHGGWNELIEQIEKKIRLRRDRYDKGRRRNKKELEFIKFCRMMADELYKFKEFWRNNTMHSISSYNEAEAHDVYIRVRDFMQRLAAHISEKNT